MNNKVNRADLVTLIAEDSGLTKKDTDAFLDSFVNVVSKEMIDGNIVNLMGFGKFLVKERAARNGVNPRTGEAMSIPAFKVPAFKASAALKDSVNGEV